MYRSAIIALQHLCHWEFEMTIFSMKRTCFVYDPAIGPFSQSTVEYVRKQGMFFTTLWTVQASMRHSKNVYHRVSFILLLKEDNASALKEWFVSFISSIHILFCNRNLDPSFKHQISYGIPPFLETWL